MNALSAEVVPTPHPVPSSAFEAQNSKENSLFNRFGEVDREAAQKAKQLKRAEWAKLPLRQSFMDEEFMRAHLKAARLRIADSNEPATVPRVRSLLRKAGVTGSEISESVGTAIAGFLTMNPSLPLWAAVALILELTGRFTPKRPRA
jgi:hypothetical protein